jgi:hypothetical protein
MPTSYPEIDLVSYFNDSVEYDCRAGRVEQGRGGVIDRKRVHFINATKRTYTINATLRDRNSLQSFLEQNRGTPFVFRFDGNTNPGLFVAKTWNWNPLVYSQGNGVWKLSLSLEEVFRPGWVPSGVITTGIAGGRGFGISLSTPSIPTLVIPTGNARGVGFSITLSINAITLPLGLAEGSGFTPQFIPGAMTVSLALGEAEAFGNGISFSTRVEIPLGQSEGVGESITLTPGVVNVTIVLGEAEGVGLGVAIVPVPVDDTRVTAAGDVRVTADGDTRITN